MRSVDLVLSDNLLKVAARLNSQVFKVISTNTTPLPNTTHIPSDNTDTKSKSQTSHTLVLTHTNVPEDVAATGVL